MSILHDILHNFPLLSFFNGSSPSTSTSEQQARVQGVASRKISKETKNLPKPAEEALRRASSDEVDFYGIPSISTPYFAPAWLQSCWHRIRNADMLKDQEGKKDAFFKMAQLPVLTIASLCGTTALLSHFNKARTWTWVGVAAKVSGILNLVCAGLETIYSLYWMRRQYRLYNRVEMQVLKAMKANPSLDKTKEIFEKHRKHFHDYMPCEERRFLRACKACKHSYGIARLRAEQKAKMHLVALALRGLEKKYFNEESYKKLKMERRIRPWMYREIQKDLPSTLKELESPTICSKKCMEKALSIFDAINVQTKKKLLFHALVLLEAVCVILSTAALIVTGGGALSTLLMIAGFVFYGGQFAVSGALIDNRDWKFTPKLLIPETIRNFPQAMVHLASRVKAAIRKKCFGAPPPQALKLLVPPPKESERIKKHSLAIRHAS